MEIFNKVTISKQIDSFFSEKKQSEQNIMYILIAAVIGYVIYQFVLTQTEIYLQNATNKVSTIKQRVNEKEIYLRVNTVAKLNKYKSEVNQHKLDYDNTIYKISYVDNTLSELSYLLFNDENWALFVDNISYMAKKYGVEIKEISNKFFDPTFQKISQVLTMEVKVKSDYKAMMKFLNNIEESKLVVDVSDMNISKPGSKLSSEFKISVWGMKY